MTQVIYQTATTLDGFLADDADSLEWLFAVPGGDADSVDSAAMLDGVGVLVMGSTTYEWLVQHENLVENPAGWAEFYGELPTVVFTSRELPVISGANIQFVRGEVAAVWPQLEALAGGLIVWLVGGGDLVGQFADVGHLDQVKVSVAPVTLGSGRPLLPRRIESDRLTLVSVAKAGAFAELTYAVSPAS